MIWVPLGGKVRLERGCVPEKASPTTLKLKTKFILISKYACTLCNSDEKGKSLVVRKYFSSL